MVIEAEKKADPLLVELVDLINQIEPYVEVPFTVTTAGGIVTGRLISSSSWWQRQGENIELTALQPLGEKYKSISADLAAIRDSRTKASEQDLIVQWILPEHIHMVNARYVFGNSLVPETKDLLWRGRLCEVVGWSFGEMTNTPSSA